MRVINISAGKSSALMAILMKPQKDDILLFCDTGREHPLSYKFLDDFERNEGVTIHRTSYTNRNAPGLFGFDALLANRKDVPNVMRRECTKKLKVMQARRYLKSIGITKYDSYIGFRFDEPDRVLRHTERFTGVKTHFPLHGLGVTKPMVDQYWLSKSYTLEIPAIMGNCDGCFLKGVNNLIKIFTVQPDLAPKWIKDEKNGTYIKGVKYSDILKIANSQTSLFDLDNARPAYACACTI